MRTSYKMDFVIDRKVNNLTLAESHALCDAIKEQWPLQDFWIATDVLTATGIGTLGSFMDPSFESEQDFVVRVHRSARAKLGRHIWMEIRATCVENLPCVTFRLTEEEVDFPPEQLPF